MDKINQNNDKTTVSKQILSESGKAFKKAGENAIFTLFNTGKGIYKLTDAGDKFIGKKIPNNNLEGSKIKEGLKNTINFTKNNIIKVFLGLSILTYGGIKSVDYLFDNNGDKKEVTIDKEGNSDEIIYVYTGNYPKFQNKKITKYAPLTKYYLGLDINNKKDINTGDTLVLNPSKTLHDMRTTKISKYGKKTMEELDKIDASKMTPEDIENFRIQYPMDATYLFVIKSYIDGNINKTRITLDKFIEMSEKTIRETETHIKDYNGGLDGNKEKLLDIFKSEISGTSIVAYAMTELCENKSDGELNKQLFDLLLQNAGTEFLSMVPAMYDSKTSYGAYQFTEYALYDTPDEKRGASKINKYIEEKENKIPGSVIDLNDIKDQTKAAYMFAIYNFAIALTKLNHKQTNKLLAYYKSNTKDFMNNITQLIAMCHHRPADSKILKFWINDNFKKNIHEYGHAQTYGKASKSNYEALQ